MAIRPRLAVVALAMGVVEFGDIAYLVSLSASLYLYGGSSMHVAYGMAAYSIGSLVGSWVGGILVDAIPARRWMLIGNTCASILVFTNVFAASLPVLVIYAAVVSIASRAMLVSQQSCLPLIDSVSLLRANSVVMICRRIGQLSGPGLAGILVARGDLHLVYVLNAATFAVAAIVGFAAVPAGTATTKKKTGESKRDFSYILRIPAVRSSFVVNCVTGILAGTSSVSIVVYTGSVLHGGAREFGLISAFTGAGAVLGTIVAPLVGRMMPIKMSVASTVVSAGVALSILPFVMWLPGAAALRAVNGYAVNVIFILLMANLQSHAPKEMYGRLIATTRSGQDSLMILFIMVSGVLVQAVGVRVVLVFVGSLAVLCAALIGLSKNPFDWEPADRVITDDSRWRRPGTEQSVG